MGCLHLFNWSFLWIYIHRCGITESYGTSSLVFLKSLPTVLYSDCINFHSHQQCVCGGAFFYTFSACIICGLFDNEHCDQSDDSSLKLWFLSNNYQCWALFICLLDIYISSLGKRKKENKKLLESKYLVLTCITHSYTAVLSIVGTRNLTGDYHLIFNCPTEPLNHT